MPERTLTDHDIEKLVDAIHEKQNHHCRFSDSITPEDLAKTITFCQDMSAAMNDTKRIVRRFFIKFGLGVLGLVIAAGTGVMTRDWWLPK